MSGHPGRKKLASAVSSFRRCRSFGLGQSTVRPPPNYDLSRKPINPWGNCQRGGGRREMVTVGCDGEDVEKLNLKCHA